jgi:hypothetical protein
LSPFTSTVWPNLLTQREISLSASLPFIPPKK